MTDESVSQLYLKSVSGSMTALDSHCRLEYLEAAYILCLQSMFVCGESGSVPLSAVCSTCLPTLLQMRSIACEFPAAADHTIAFTTL